MSTWDEWLATLPADLAGRATELRGLLRDAGCPDPEAWVQSEIDEGIPQAARYRFLRSLWPKMIDGWRERIDALAVAQPLLRQGVDRDSLVQVARAVAYDTVFSMLYHLGDDGAYGDAVDRLPRWRLVEVDEDRITGRTLGGLFEDLLSMDPSGDEGADIVPPLPGPWNRSR